MTVISVIVWTAAIAQSDGFVFVTPEYNYGPPGVLKNVKTARERNPNAS